MLPDAEHAVVDEKKILDYLLSETHPDGKNKAAFFLAFGFSRENQQTFAAALIEHAKSNTMTKTVQFLYGTRYVVEGTLQTPDQRNPHVRTVWVVEAEGDAPRLVTAYPL